MPSSSILNTVRTYKNYGLQAYGNTFDPILTKGWINASPNVLIQGSSCYIDYSHSYDTSDLIFLKRTFGRFSAGNTFYFQPEDYYDEMLGSKSSIGGTLTFISTLNNGKIIIGNVISGLTYSSTYNFYSKDNFASPPQYIFSNTGFTGNFILNSLPHIPLYSFKEMGFLGSELGFEEYIDYSGATGVNYGRLKIQGTSTLQDGQEILYISSGLSYQNMIDSATELKMYIRGISDVTEIQEPENITGIYQIYDSNNKVINCFENQNYYQVHLRKQVLDNTYSGYWISCETCPKNLYSEDLATDGVQSNLVFDNSVYFFIVPISTSTGLSTSVTNVYNVFTQRTFSGSAQNASRLSFTITQGLKIDLSHASLQGWQFKIYTDPLYTIPLANNLYVSGQPGYDQSYVLIKSTESTPRTLYCQFIGPQTINTVINI